MGYHNVNNYKDGTSTHVLTVFMQTVFGEMEKPFLKTAPTLEKLLFNFICITFSCLILIIILKNNVNKVFKIKFRIKNYQLQLFFPVFSTEIP